MDLKHLRHLVDLAETGSFSRTAERLNLTQSALSRSIQTLESSLNVQLIDRASKRNELTSLGVMVVERARRVLYEASEITADLSRLTTFGLGTLSLGLDPAPSALLLAPFLGFMASRYPKVRVMTRRESPSMHLDALRRHELDALLIDPRNLPPSDDLRVEFATHLRSNFIVRAGHPLAGPKPVRFAELANYPVTSSPFSDESGRTLVERFGSAANPAQFITVESDDWTAMLEAVRGSDLIQLGAIAIARPLLDAGEVVELKTNPAMQTSVKMALVTIAGRTELPTMSLLRAFVETRLREEAQRDADY